MLASQIERAPFGPVTAMTRGNGLTEIRSLDQAYQIDAITVPGLMEGGWGYAVDAAEYP